MKIIINFFLGLVALLLIVIIYGLFNGDNPFELVSDFVGFIVISVVCTAGIGLFVWIPVVMVLGATLGKIIELLSGNRLKLRPVLYGNGKSSGANNVNYQSMENSSMNPSSNNELAIIGYIVTSRNAKMSDEIIYSNLVALGGWKKEHVDMAFKRCSPRI